MEVMTKGFDQTTEIVYGAIDAPDRSTMKGIPLMPSCRHSPDGEGLVEPPSPMPRAPLQSMEYFDREFRAGLGYHQPASPLASVGLIAAATGTTASKYVARRQTPVFIAENCTQCMECIAACPDTAMPNTAQDIGAVLGSAVRNYVTEVRDRDRLVTALPELEAAVRERMDQVVANKGSTPFAEIVGEVVESMNGVGERAQRELSDIIGILPVAYTKSHAIFKSVEKKTPGEGGLFSIFINDRCKGCGECVVECGDHDALRMVPDTEELNTKYLSTGAFLDTLPETPQKFLGLYDPQHPEESRTATLRNHLMTRRNYEALTSGDGACAGCGEKSVLRSITTVTEAYMRPVFHAKADRLRAKADRLESEGVAALEALAKNVPAEHKRFRRAVAHLLMGLGGENLKDIDERMKAHDPISDAQIIDAIVTVMRQDAYNHKDLQSVEGRLSNGMAVMAMGANTGCNTVYGSTPPNNPHPYPWMNSLFQDGATITWIMGESFIMDHARRSVTPERLADALLEGDRGGITEQQYYELSHLRDTLMTDQEVLELPKAWAVGGDGGMGDIGFQNVSKAILQNRPNVKLLMLDTQVYSNTGGQNSDSSPLPGGYDMNQFGAASQGKLTEKKSLAEIFSAGHGSPLVAQVSMANAAKLYRVILDALAYRGTAFLQCFTTCQPEHGVGDDMATVQAGRIRDSRGMPEFVFNSGLSEIYAEAIDLKGNPDLNEDWWTTRFKKTKQPYRYTVAHWAATEARFRRHFKEITEDRAAGMTHLDDML
ncbi:MAG: thiamine pyrophosphate-dependent enzyme, partial [Planctomycetota bacterium]